MQSFYSNGKLLITGEYLVLKGAKSLAIPVKYGQNLIVHQTGGKSLVWKSFDYRKSLWFSAEFSLPDLKIEVTDQPEMAGILQNMLKQSQQLNIDFLKNSDGLLVETHLSFDQNWGLGTSSTLINNLSQWAKIDAFLLSSHTLGGSGYDIACAQSGLPIQYQIKNGSAVFEPVQFDPVFKDQLFFVYLNQKQNSRDAIAHFNAGQNYDSRTVEKVNSITDKIIRTKKLKAFENLIEVHEQIVAEVLQDTPVQKKFFPDYFGKIKSLGAWGGDFILATGNESTPEYFKAKGFKTVIPFSEMVL